MVKKTTKKEDDSKLFALLGILLTVVGFIIAYVSKKNNKYVMFYAKQGLVLFIGWVIVAIIGMIPFIGWMIQWLGSIGLLILWVIGMVYSLSGEMKNIPLIGDFAKKFDF